MNWLEIPFVTELISGTALAALGWFFGGRQAMRSSKVDDARKIIEEWRALKDNCEIELKQLKEEIRAMKADYKDKMTDRDDQILRLRNEIKVLRSHIKKLEEK